MTTRTDSSLTPKAASLGVAAGKPPARSARAQRKPCKRCQQMRWFLLYVVAVLFLMGALLAKSLPL